MRLATVPATLWPLPEPRSRIVLYAWYTPAPEAEKAAQPDPEALPIHDADCASTTGGRSSGPQ